MSNNSKQKRIISRVVFRSLFIFFLLMIFTSLIISTLSLVVTADIPKVDSENPETPKPTVTETGIVGDNKIGTDKKGNIYYFDKNNNIWKLISNNDSPFRVIRTKDGSGIIVITKGENSATAVVSKEGKILNPIGTFTDENGEKIMIIDDKVYRVHEDEEGEVESLEKIDPTTGKPTGEKKPGYGADCKDHTDCATGVCGNAGCSDSRIENGKTQYWRNINEVIDAMSKGASFGQSLSSLLGLDFSEWEEMISSFFEESVMGKMLGAQEDLICGEPSFNVDPNSAVVVEVNGQVYYGLYITCERSQIAYYYNDTSSSKEYYYMWNYRVMNTNEDLNYYNIMFRGNGVSKNYYNKWQNITAGGTESYIDSSAMVDNSSNYYDEICVKLKYEIEDASGNKRSQVCNKCSEPSYEDVEVPYNTEEESNSSSAVAGSSSKEEEDPKNSNW